MKWWKRGTIINSTFSAPNKYLWWTHATFEPRGITILNIAIGMVERLQFETVPTKQFYLSIVKIDIKNRLWFL